MVKLLMAPVEAVVVVAAWLWVRRAVLLDTAGAVALVVAAAHVGPGLAWLVAGVWCTVRGYGISK